MVVYPALFTKNSSTFPVRKDLKIQIQFMRDPISLAKVVQNLWSNNDMMYFMKMIVWLLNGYDGLLQHNLGTLHFHLQIAA